jgi:serine/threonine protein phosphatase PrpC
MASMISSPKLILESAHASKQGVRPSLEDCLIDMPKFNVSHSKCTSGQHALYAVFDGHGSDKVAKACVHLFPELLANCLESHHDINKALHESVIKLDETVLTRVDSNKAGAVTVIALIDVKDNKIWVINVGDARCVIISQKQDKNYVQPLSKEHRPQSKELLRIEQNGGFVNKRGYVMNVLAMTRVIGDGDVKKANPNVIINTPDIQTHSLTENDKFLILGCDGLWDVMSNEQVEQYLLSFVIDNPQITLKEISERLSEDAINKFKSTDNVSVIIVKLHELTDNE